MEPAVVRPIAAPTRAPAGSLLAIGNRVLLLLGCGKQRDPRASRFNMVGESEAAWGLRERIQTVARFHETVLILGDTGTGKELVAQAIHRLGGASGEFVALNMGGLDGGIAGSELFGHVKGAFTGAHRDHVGAFEAARKGTLFLDEIGELPLDLQKKLLRVLEARQYFPVGGRAAKDANCRVMAATNSRLDVEVTAGRFRRDLFERLNALSVQMPSLRERWEDVPQLFCHFLAERTREQPSLRWLWQGTVESPTPIPIEFMIELMRRQWPGNIRELRNVVTATAATNLTPGQFIRPSETTAVPAETRAENGEPRRPAPANALPLTLPPHLIEAALRRCHGNVRASADLLGCSRHQLYRWMKARSLDITHYRDEPGDA
jgi:DNA-binding NtrC family response regulator